MLCRGEAARTLNGANRAILQRARATMRPPEQRASERTEAKTMMTRALDVVVLFALRFGLVIDERLLAAAVAVARRAFRRRGRLFVRAAVDFFWLESVRRFLPTSAMTRNRKGLY